MRRCRRHRGLADLLACRRSNHSDLSSPAWLIRTSFSLSLLSATQKCNSEYVRRGRSAMKKRVFLRLPWAQDISKLKFVKLFKFKFLSVRYDYTESILEESPEMEEMLLSARTGCKSCHHRSTLIIITSPFLFTQPICCLEEGRDNLHLYISLLYSHLLLQSTFYDPLQSDNFFL